ncbi:MAG: ABC transporter substrate-binding protein, partial [Bacteroidota bacterium]
QGIDKVKDLVGKSVAVEEGFVGHFFLLYVLDQAGISPEEVKIIPMTTDQAGTAFLSGSVDVAVTWEPLLSSALSRKGAKVLVSSADVEPILADALFLSEAFLESKPLEAKNLVQALLEANELWLKQPGKYTEFISQKWDWPVEDISGALATVEVYGTQKQQELFGTAKQKGKIYEFLDKANELWHKTGIIAKRVDVQQLVQPSLINN